jgi:hypothetical protein
MSRKNMTEKQQIIIQCYQLALMDRRVFSRGADPQPIAMQYLDDIIKAADVWYSEESKTRNSSNHES